MEHWKNREIGGEFFYTETANTINRVFPDDCRWFISGTAALNYILSDILSMYPVKVVSLPSWCCSCMIEPFVKNNINVRFYPVYFANGSLVCDYSSVGASDVTLELSYFGYSSIQTIGKASGLIIRDLTHSIFMPNNGKADYYFGSLRKWTGVWTGGYAWKCGKWNTIQSISVVSSEYIKLRKTAMELKRMYINGVGDKKYLGMFDKAEEYLDRCGIENAINRDKQVAKYLDVENILKKRRENASYLLNSLSEYAIFPTVLEGDCPMFVPILIANDRRDALRDYLISKEIYCPIHWGISDKHRLDSMTRRLYEQELSIVCDQRYTTTDMERILVAIDDSGIMS